jgi:hypothetical protein
LFPFILFGLPFRPVTLGYRGPRLNGVDQRPVKFYEVIRVMLAILKAVVKMHTNARTTILGV